MSIKQIKLNDEWYAAISEDFGDFLNIHCREHNTRIVYVRAVGQSARGCPVCSRVPSKDVFDKIKFISPISEYI